MGHRGGRVSRSFTISALVAGLLAAGGGSLAAAARAASAQSSVTSLRQALDRRMGAAGLSSGAYVYDVTANRVLYARRSGVPRQLASNTKLFTTAAALERFGPGARLETSVLGTGDIRPQPAAAGASGDGAYELEGSLYLHGGGDPALGSRAFANRYLGGLVTQAIALADQVEATGIRRVSGRLYADDSLFDRLRGVPYSGFRLTSYIGPLSALSYNSGYAGEFARGFAPDPARVAAEQLRRALVRRGVRVDKGVQVRRLAGGTGKVLAKVESPAMADLVRETNRESNNFFAEMLLKGIGARFGAGGTTKAGVAVVRSFAARHGSGVAAFDGSGLTHANSASPRAVVGLLRSMLGRPAYASFYGSLPIAGRQGTLRKRMRGTPAQDACRAKTGTIDGVSTLSGYCRTRGGHDVVFSFLMNGVNVIGARRLQDGMVVLIAKYRG